MGQLRVAWEAMAVTQTIRILQVLEKGLVGEEEERETACHLKKRACPWRLPGMKS